MTRLDRLAALGALLRDRDLARVHKAATACRETDMRLATLSRPLPLAETPALMTARQAHVAWAHTQSLSLTRTLALQKATLSDCRAQAARSLARAQVLHTLAQVRK